MFEKVNPSHPDKIADRIAGAVVDYAYTKEKDPKIAVEVLIGHGDCLMIVEASVDIPFDVASGIVSRIAGSGIHLNLRVVKQDRRLAKNQSGRVRCGDNGIFCGMPVTKEQKQLSSLVKRLYSRFPYDGKYIINKNRIVACQSNAERDGIMDVAGKEGEWDDIVVNPIGYWTGGTSVDSGATNRKLGSDMGDAVTGGGLHGKDLSKTDVSVNIYAHIKAQETGKPIRLCCAIGDADVDGIPYDRIVSIAREYIQSVGGFEKFAEWGLI